MNRYIYISTHANTPTSLKIDNKKIKDGSLIINSSSQVIKSQATMYYMDTRLLAR